MYLTWNTSQRRLKEAEQARRNRAEIVTALSHGQLRRRDLLRMGLITAGGGLALKNGLSPFAPSAYAAVPTGLPPSPIPPGLAFTQQMPRLSELQRKPVSALSPAPTRLSNQTFNSDKGVGPIEGRPPGELWAHQRWEEFFPKVAFEASTRPLLPNHRFHPDLPEIQAERLWTFDGTLPYKLIKARYGEPILFRHLNRLPSDVSQNGGFGRNTLTTHLHNGHTPAESDGFAGAFFFTGQFYDYRWPMILAGHDTINVDGTDPRAGSPDDNGGIIKVPGDWREIQSTMWFHDHMVDFTAQNLYKGNAGMLNLYSSVDRGNEEIDDGVNLRLPSGSTSSWGNTAYDVNLLIADKALDANGQLHFDIFNLDGFLGDMMTVNGAFKPYFEVERRKYRFRILNACIARFLKLCLSDGSPFFLIANDGNLLTHPLTMSQLPQLGIAERYDIVIDFSRYKSNQRVYLVNLTEHVLGRGPERDLSLSEALAGISADPAVGSFLEFRVIGDPPKPDRSQVPARMTELPAFAPVVRERTFEFGRSGGSDSRPWTIEVNGGNPLGTDLARISTAPRPGTAEIWHLNNGGNGWEHPVHIHFEEGQTLSRNGTTPPDHERFARKDVWRIGGLRTASVYLQFREFAGTYMEHCHNAVHEDRAMLLRWDINGGPTPLPLPVPTPSGCTFIDSQELP
jgi:manganese oxidase